MLERGEKWYQTKNPRSSFLTVTSDSSPVERQRRFRPSQHSSGLRGLGKSQCRLERPSRTPSKNLPREVKQQQMYDKRGKRFLGK